MDICTHRIIHLEHTVEMQHANLKERVMMIANLKQQLLELQGLEPPAPLDHEEIDAMSSIDEDRVSSLLGCGESLFG
jgi:hypothetical protein